MGDDKASRSIFFFFLRAVGPNFGSLPKSASKGIMSSSATRTIKLNKERTKANQNGIIPLLAQTMQSKIVFLRA